MNPTRASWLRPRWLAESARGEGIAVDGGARRRCRGRNIVGIFSSAALTTGSAG